MVNQLVVFPTNSYIFVSLQLFLSIEKWLYNILKIMLLLFSSHRLVYILFNNFQKDCPMAKNLYHREARQIPEVMQQKVLQ